MTRRRIAILLSVLAPSSALAAAAAKAAPKIDPDAVAALHKMGDFLRAQCSFTVAAEASTDDVLPNGQKVKVHSVADLKVRRPDRLRAIVSSDRQKEEMFYDGSSFTIHDVPTNYYAIFKAPPTLQAMVDVAENRYGIDFPLADLFTWGSEHDQGDALKAAVNLGPSAVKGTACTHYAYRENDVDWQIWIQDGDKPFPRRLVITTTAERGAPEHDVVMDWTLTADFGDKVFVFTPPSGAEQIEIRPAPGLAGGPRTRMTGTNEGGTP